jgi:hypothetical protein
VHLGIGNHELYFHGNTNADDELSHAEFIRKFSQWLGGSKTAYYHWKVRQVDFVSMDNSRNAGFEPEQLSWLEMVLKQDAADSNVRAVVVGMHRALPNSLACGHSMNGEHYWQYQVQPTAELVYKVKEETFRDYTEEDIPHVFQQPSGAIETCTKGPKANSPAGSHRRIAPEACQMNFL